MLAKTAMDVPLGLDDRVRERIARTAAESALRPVWWQRLLPMSASPVLAIVAPVALVLLAVALPMTLRTSPAPRASQEPVRIDMQVAGSTVRLAWTDGRGRPYRVYKSTDPRQLGRGPAQEVRGNQWVDSEADSALIVYYRVE